MARGKTHTNTQNCNVKMCLRCRKPKGIGEFYANKAWVSQSCADIYCKECARKICTTKENLKKYCFDNNRRWIESTWDAAKKRALRSLANDQEWLNPKTSEIKKLQIEERHTCAAFLAMMNLNAYYSFVDNSASNGEYNANPIGASIDSDGNEVKNDDDEMVYDETWNGTYSKAELRQLNKYFDQLCDDFVVDNVNLKDYAKKVARASLEADKKYNQMRRGECSLEDWQKAQKMFDDMSKSAKFAEIQRKAGDSTGLGSTGRIILDIEVNHQASKPKVTYPKDTIDLILEDLAHVETAIQ